MNTYTPKHIPAHTPTQIWVKNFLCPFVNSFVNIRAYSIRTRLQSDQVEEKFIYFKNVRSCFFPQSKKLSRKKKEIQLFLKTESQLFLSVKTLLFKTLKQCDAHKVTLTNFYQNKTFRALQATAAHLDIENYFVYVLRRKVFFMRFRKSKQYQIKKL